MFECLIREYLNACFRILPYTFDVLHSFYNLMGHDNLSWNFVNEDFLKGVRSKAPSNPSVRF